MKYRQEFSEGEEWRESRNLMSFSQHTGFVSADNRSKRWFKGLESGISRPSLRKESFSEESFDSHDSFKNTSTHKKKSKSKNMRWGKGRKKANMTFIEKDKTSNKLNMDKLVSLNTLAEEVSFYQLNLVPIQKETLSQTISSLDFTRSYSIMKKEPIFNEPTRDAWPPSLPNKAISNTRFLFF